ncbi:imelysin family protein [Azovibrio restrictus]|uniref:imelysin family protein n=1 Tax=Azovibrio restrictus TaxID=146938 RepID=UPI0026EC0C82|nr:imelysin family protein [Azovibrio restrictus]MDD3481546.1 imelysin family protein [Azovibrio restrictus]
MIFQRVLFTLAALLLGVSLQAGAQVPTPEAVNRNYAEIVHASYQDSLTSALLMQEAIQVFVAAPSESSQQAARRAWLAAREWYGQTEAYRFYAGPIDDENGPEGRLNAWPLDEAYVDYVKGRADAGIINTPSITITKAELSRLNERGGEENIAAGWHAIEFLLWGQDFSATGPGNRSYEDFVDGKAAHADRRRQYLLTATELLIDDLRYLGRAWAPDALSNYRARFERGGLESVRKIIIGLGSLSRGELAGERLEVAMNTQDQEDEHSCFSDNTHRDAVTNAKGIENVWFGRYRRLDGSMVQGASLAALVAASNPALAQRVGEQITASVQAAEAIQAPFDREIIGSSGAPGRQRIQKTIDALVAQSKGLVEAAAAIGITRLTLSAPK